MKVGSYLEHLMGLEVLSLLGDLEVQEEQWLIHHLKHKGVENQKLPHNKELQHGIKKDLGCKISSISAIPT